MKYNIHIPYLDVVLETSFNKDRKQLNNLRLPCNVSIFASYEDGTVIEFSLDERYNLLSALHIGDEDSENYKRSMEIISRFNDLKNSNFKYGTMGIDEYYEYEPSVNIFIEDFFDYLKKEKRDIIINKMING